MSDGPQNPPSPNDSNVFQLILGSKTLPDKEKSHKRITEEAFDLLIPGGETTSRILTTATYHILANMDRVLPRLKAELSSLMVDRDTRPEVKDLEKLPWLVSVAVYTCNCNKAFYIHTETAAAVQTAIIKESLRIAGLVTSRLPLISPIEPLRYGAWEIPAGVISFPPSPKKT